jgi:3-oxoadipate enol-lactonase
MTKSAMSPMSIHHYHITKNGTKVHYELQGSATGRLVVLLHGLGGSTRTFKPLLPHLPSTYQILAVDFEGFGETPLANASVPHTIDRYVADLEDLISYLQRVRICKEEDPGIQPIIIIGHSLGSIVALHYAAKHTEDIAGLILLSVGRSASHIPAAKERMLALAATVRSQGMSAVADIAASSNFPSGEGTTDEMREEIRQTVGSSNAEAYAQMCEEMVSPSHQDPDYAAITCPVVLVGGFDDTISPPSRAVGLAPLFGGSCNIVSVKGGHQPVLSDLEGTCHAVEQLIKLVRSDRANDRVYFDKVLC